MSWKLGLAALALAGLLTGGVTWYIKWQNGKIEALTEDNASLKAANKALEESNRELALADKRKEAAISARDANVEQIKREYADYKARVEAAMQSDPDSQAWSLEHIPPAVLGLLSAPGSNPDASDHPAPASYPDARVP